MKALRRLSIAVPALLLIASLIGIYLTRGAMANLPFLSGGKARTLRGSTGIVDQRAWQTIEALAPLAVSAEEKRLAREAQRVADHEVDQAFAQALAVLVGGGHPPKPPGRADGQGKEQRGIVEKHDHARRISVVGGLTLK